MGDAIGDAAMGGGMALRPSAPLHPTKPTSEVASHACFIIHSVHQDSQQPTAHRIHPVILVVVVEENQRSPDWETQLVTRPLEGEIWPCDCRRHFTRRSQHPKWPAMPASSYTRSIRIRSNRRRIASIQTSWWW